LAPVYGAPLKITIGRRGRSCGAARWAESREQAKGVGGWLCRARVGRVQRKRKRNGAWRGRDGARQGRAMVSWCRGLDAVRVLVLSGAGQGTDARERDARAACSGCAAASIWRGQGDANGQDRGQLLQGIGSRCRGGSGGEVTGRGVVGGKLALLECPRRAWRWPGRRGGF
jgi:hypothetical protein